MAKFKIFSVRDAIADAFLPPFYVNNTHMAKRTFANCADDPKHQFSVNPNDYALFELGEFDDTTGNFTMLPTPLSLGLAINYKAKG